MILMTMVTSTLTKHLLFKKTMCFINIIIYVFYFLKKYINNGEKKAFFEKNI